MFKSLIFLKVNGVLCQESLFAGENFEVHGKVSDNSQNKRSRTSFEKKQFSLQKLSSQSEIEIDFNGKSKLAILELLQFNDSSLKLKFLLFKPSVIYENFARYSDYIVSATKYLCSFPSDNRFPFFLLLQNPSNSNEPNLEQHRRQR